MKSFIILPLLLTSCLIGISPSSTQTENESTLADRLALFYAICRAGDSMNSNVYKIEDMRNGSIRIQKGSYTKYGCSLYKDNYKVEQTLYVKKCLQGQTYRYYENDCRGAGNAANNYNAQLYTWCNTADMSCNQAGNLQYADPALSPAAQSCASDILLSKKWSNSAMNIFRSTSYVSNKDREALTSLQGLITDKPLDLNAVYWTNQGYSGSPATEAVVVYLNDFNIETHLTKTMSAYVLCNSAE